MLGIGQISTRIAELIRGALPFAVVDNGTYRDGTTRPISEFAKLISYSHPQQAIDAGHKRIICNEGLYLGPTTLNKDYITLEGQGWATVLNGDGDGNALLISSDHCYVHNLICETDSGGAGGGHHCILVSGAWNYLLRVRVNESDDQGMYFSGQNNTAMLCEVDNCDYRRFASYAAYNRIIACAVSDGYGSVGIQFNSNYDANMALGNLLKGTNGYYYIQDSTSNDGIIVSNLHDATSDTSSGSGWVVADNKQY